LLNDSWRNKIYNQICQIDKATNGGVDGKLSWKEIEHTADTGIEVIADRIEDIFLESAQAFYALMSNSSYSLNARKKDHAISLVGMDLGDLAVQWLNELVYLWETENSIFVPNQMEVDFQKASLNTFGFLVEVPDSGGRIKAATYGGLVMETDPVFFLRVFLDV